MSDGDGAEALFAIAVVLVALSLLVLASAVAAIIWLVIASILAAIRREHLRKQAKERFDRVISDEGVDIPLDEVFRAMSIGGVVPESRGYDEFDLMGGVPFGVGEAYEGNRSTPL